MALSLLAAAACSSTGAVNPYFDASKPHHRPGGFQNNYLPMEPKSLWAVFKWRVSSAVEGLPRPPKAPVPVVAPDLTFIRANAVAGANMQPAATWVGHSTMLLQIGGLNLLTDPQFNERASPFSFVGPKRAQAPGVALKDLPHIDAVLISHNHYDHLDVMSVQALNAQPGGPPLFIVPLGIKPWLAGIGISNAVELDWWQSHKLTSATGVTEVFLTPVQHWSARSLRDRLQTLWGGFAVFAPEFHLYFSGDLGYSKDIADTRERFAARQGAASGGGFDLAMIAIGCYEPRWFMKDQHVNPAEGVQVFKDVGAKRAVGVHWGTFSGLCDEPIDQAAEDLALARTVTGVKDDEFFVMKIGETRKLPRRLDQ
jgi:N-acyl-phosphatidylethanolamine-hydrolysing phospholipase D